MAKAPPKTISTPRAGATAEELRSFMRRAFAAVAGDCTGQDGWPCRTCFFYTMDMLGLPEEEVHAMWLIQLRLRNNGSRLDTWKVTTTKVAAA